MADRVIQRNDTAARWQSINPVLAQGELGIVSDGAKGYKIGDGVTAWNSLEYPANPTSVVQELGNSETAVISQKIVTDSITKIGYDIISTIPSAYLSGMVAIKSIKCYVPDVYINNKFSLRFLGVSDSTFVFGIWDDTRNVSAYQIIPMDVTPVLGVQTLIFDDIITSTNKDQFYFEVVIDWSMYQNTYLSLQVGQFPIYPTSFSESKIQSNLDLIALRGEVISIIGQIPTKYKNSLIGVKDIKCYVPDPSQKYSLRFLGISNGSFIFGIYNDTTGINKYYKIVEYDTLPTSGVETIIIDSFIQEGYYFEITVDWSELNSANYVSAQMGEFPIYPVRFENNYIDFFREIPTQYRSILNYTKSIEFYVPDIYINSSYRLRFFGYSSTLKQFQLGVWMGDKSIYGLSKVYDTLPTSGVEKILFTEYNGFNCYLSVTIDWSKYNGLVYSLPPDTGFIVYPKPISQWNGIINGISTDIGDAIINANLLSGTFTLNKPVTLVEGTCINGKNCSINCSDSAKIVMAQGSSIRGVRFSGDWEYRETVNSRVPALISEQDLYDETSEAFLGVSSNITDSLIYIPANGAYNTLIDSCIFEKFNKPVIYTTGDVHIGWNNAQIRGCEFNSCRMGIAGFGEFERIIGNNFHACVIGVYYKGGNVNFIGNFMKQCDCGFYIPVGTNGSHGQHTGNEIAHCSVAGLFVQEIAINTGDNWTGNQIVDAPIICKVANNLMFVGCRLDTYIRIESGQRNAIMTNNVGISYIGSHPLYDVPADTIITLNIPINPATSSQVNK